MSLRIQPSCALGFVLVSVFFNASILCAAPGSSEQGCLSQMEVQNQNNLKVLLTDFNRAVGQLGAESNLASDRFSGVVSRNLDDLKHLLASPRSADGAIDTQNPQNVARLRVIGAYLQFSADGNGFFSQLSPGRFQRGISEASIEQLDRLSEILEQARPYLESLSFSGPNPGGYCRLAFYAVVEQTDTWALISELFPNSNHHPTAREIEQALNQRFGFVHRDLETAITRIWWRLTEPEVSLMRELSWLNERNQRWNRQPDLAMLPLSPEMLRQGLIQIWEHFGDHRDVQIALGSPAVIEILFRFARLEISPDRKETVEKIIPGFIRLATREAARGRPMLSADLVEILSQNHQLYNLRVYRSGSMSRIEDFLKSQFRRQVVAQLERDFPDGSDPSYVKPELFFHFSE